MGMTNLENENILMEFRKIVKTGHCSNDKMKEILRAHNCIHLINHKDLDPDDKLVHFAHCLAIKERYKNIQFLLESISNIPYAIIKGAVLSEQLYHSPFTRHSGDIDILIRRENLSTVKQLLLNNGFVQGRIDEQGIVPFTRRELIFYASQSHQTAPFVKRTANKLCPYINLDLNTAIYWGEYEGSCNMDIVFEQIQDGNILDRRIKKLSPEMEFITLCLHHYKDMNSIYLLTTGSLKLNLFCDIYFYIKNVRVDYDKLYFLASKLHATPYIFYCLYYTDIVFDCDAIKKIIHMFESTLAHSLISTFGLCATESHPWSISFLDRLFSSSFCDNFYLSLSEEEQRKVQTNSMFM